MCTSVIKKSRMIYGTAAIFCFIFQFIYEYFSHSVYSIYMVGAFFVPLCGGILAEIFLRLLQKRHAEQNTFPLQLLGGSIIWLTLGSIFKGVLEIYGTTNHLIIIFLIVGIAQLLAAFITEIALTVKH